MTLISCDHNEVFCINPYEYIRKYKCKSCGEVMMCSCDEDFGRRFLPHQLSNGTDLITKQVMPVTIGFQRNICNTCRGKPEEPHPRAEIYGCCTKIRRYYWREIESETIRRFGDWAEKEGYADWLKARFKEKVKYNSIEKNVIEEFKDLHKRFPKYLYTEESQKDIIERNNVEVINLSGIHVHYENCLKILDGAEKRTPEEFVAHYFENLEFNVMHLESSPLHALFGCLMFQLIQDPLDPRLKTIGFGDRNEFDFGVNGKCIWTSLPEDFGSSGYALRREKEIEEYFDALPKCNEDFTMVF